MAARLPLLLIQPVHGQCTYSFNVAMFGSLAIESQKQLPRVGQNSSRLRALVRKPWFFTLTSVWPFQWDLIDS